MQASPSALIIGSDHAGFELKEKIATYLVAQKIPVQDVGTSGTDSVDYPDFGIQVATAVSRGEYKRGILICGTGIGMSMVANKFPHVRAALCGGLFGAIMSRRHNDANVLVLGGRVTGDALALEMVRMWLETPFEGGRHQTRLAKFDHLQA